MERVFVVRDHLMSIRPLSLSLLLAPFLVLSPLALSSLALSPLAGCGKTEPSKDLAELFPGNAPTFPPQASKLTIGVGEEEAKTLVPDIFGAKYMELMLPKFGKRVQISAAFYSAESEGKWLRHVEVDVPTEAGLAAITAQWGAPQTFEVHNFGSEKLETHHVWFNPAASLRAITSPHGGYPDVTQVMVGEYLALESFIGKDGELGAKKTPIIGSSIAALKAAFGERFSTREAEGITGEMETFGSVTLPPVGQAKDEFSADISFEGTVATGYEITFSASETEANQAVLAQLEAQFGAGSPGRLYPHVTVYPSEIGASTELNKQRLRVRIGPKAKIETK